ncbi:TonB-dependent siderophore receptor [Tropicimonas sp. IMCC34011]|uniref:TonB-dependent receptor plug domain-containing protein n=1 Tax=Tropicimonas sp. IMCC34011 TaxID=2248759 RepID=UPI000E227178|nr:TonB-dependent receptor [Tropicimonas sp. IMCC34011]
MRASLLSAGLVATTALTPIALHAQEVLATDAFDLDTIFVSGGLTPLRFGDYARAASIVTGEELEARGIATVQEALTALPGVSVNGTSSNLSQIRIRGGEANHTLVLIDGIEAAAGDGEYYLSGLSARNIERIEVLRGPQSVFYGSNASSGVVNIITRTGSTGTQYGGSLEVGAGSYNSSGYVSFRDDRGGMSLSFTDREDEGVDLSGEGEERDGTERRSVVAKGDYEVLPGLTIGAIGRVAEEDFGYDATVFPAPTADDYVINSDDETHVEEQTAGIWAEYEMLDGRLTHRLSWKNTQNERAQNDEAPTKTETTSAEYILSFGLDGRSVATTDHQLNLLLEQKEDSSSTDPDYDRSSDSIALEYRGAIGALDLQAGVRYSENDPFEDERTYTIAASYQLENGLRFHASAGRGVVNPSYIELYDTQFSTGNPDLEPETNRSWDAGIEVPVLGGRGTVDVTYFREVLENEIIYQFTPGGPDYRNEDGESDRRGVEVAALLDVSEDLSFRGAYTWLDAEDPDGDTEIRRPEHELSLGVTYAFLDDRALAAVDVRHVSGLYDTEFFTFDADDIELDDFTIVDFSGRYALTDEVSLTARIENAFDEDYTEVLGYETRGRTAYVGLQADF